MRAKINNKVCAIGQLEFTGDNITIDMDNRQIKFYTDGSLTAVAGFKEGDRTSILKTNGNKKHAKIQKQILKKYIASANKRCNNIGVKFK